MDTETNELQASDGRPPLLPKSSALAMIEETTAALQPPSRDSFALEVTSCLTLCAPSGMDREDRKEWLKVAAVTLQDFSGAALAEGCREARRNCKRVSEIVPTIVAAAQTEQSRLERRLAMAQLAAKRPEPVALIDTDRDERPLTLQEIACLPASVRRMGLANGWITQEQLDEAYKLQDGGAE